MKTLNQLTKEALEAHLQKSGFVVVPENKRLEFFPALFMTESSWMLKGENCIYGCLQEWLEEYNGTFLEFYQSTDGKFRFVVPMIKELNGIYNVQNPSNWFDGEMNSLQLGIACTLTAMNSVVWGMHEAGHHKESGALADSFYEHKDKLLDMLYEIKCSSEVLRLLD